MLSTLTKLAVKNKPKTQSFPLSQKTCFDIIYQEDFPIDKYIRGEFISEDYPAITLEEARKRLIFFVGEMNNLKGYCSNIEYLEKEIESNVFSGNCQNSNVIFEEGKFTHVIYKLDFEYPVYVMLSDLLGAVLESGKQIFALIPSDRTYNKTQSFEVFLGGSCITATTCQTYVNDCKDGTKRIYDIITCNDEDGLCVKHSDREIPLSEEEKIQQQQRIDKYLSSRRNERRKISSALDQDLPSHVLMNDPLFLETFRLIKSLRSDLNQILLYNKWQNRLESAMTIEQVAEINDMVRFIFEFFRKISKYDIQQNKTCFYILNDLFSSYESNGFFTTPELRKVMLDYLSNENIRIFRYLYPSQADTIKKLSSDTMTNEKLRKIADFYNINIKEFIEDDFAIKMLIIAYRDQEGDTINIDDILHK